MIAVFKNNKFDRCIGYGTFLEYLKIIQTRPEYVLYDIEFNDNPDLYDFILDVENRVRWFRKFDICMQIDGLTFVQRLKILFTGKI